MNRQSLISLKWFKDFKKGGVKMVKTDWKMHDVIRPEDLNQIGTEINEAKSKAATAETPAGAQSKVDAALEAAKEYTDAVVSEIPTPPVTSVNSKTGAVTLGKDDIGLGNVENVKQASKSEFDTHVGATSGAHAASVISVTGGTNVQAEIDNLKSSVSDGKTVVAAAITGKGVPTAASVPFQTMAENIDAIVTDPSGDATATAADLLGGKTAYSQYHKLTGTMANRTGHVTGQSISRSGTTLRIRPQQGHYPADVANGVQWDDVNWIAENIRDGVDIFGLIGTLIEGRKSASGKVMATPKTDSYYKISVSGLAFQPSVIIGKPRETSSLPPMIYKRDLILGAYVNYFNWFTGSIQTYAFTTTQGTSDNQFRILPNGFDMIVYRWQGSGDWSWNVEWLAIE